MSKYVDSEFHFENKTESKEFQMPDISTQYMLAHCTTIGYYFCNDRINTGTTATVLEEFMSLLYT